VVKGRPAGEFRHRRGRPAGADPAAHQAIRRAGDRISNDETGISEDRTCASRAQEDRGAGDGFGIKPHDIVVDPLVMPIGAMGTAGKQVFALVRRLREELKVNTSCGAS
jgi:cobalamin-dependent methionine synthase I